jgi:hypothetical protein
MQLLGQRYEAAEMTQFHDPGFISIRRIFNIIQITTRDVIWRERRPATAVVKQRARGTLGRTSG